MSFSARSLLAWSSPFTSTDAGCVIMCAILCSCYSDSRELSAIRQVRYFVGVAETLSFRQASKQLYVSQPSLSVQVKQLEHELGVSLLRRSKRGVEITRAGEIFLVRCGATNLVETQASVRSGAACGERRGGNGPTWFCSDCKLPYPSPASRQNQKRSCSCELRA